MAKVISFGNRKGGVGKTITTSILAYLMSKKKRVLAIDLDSQCHLTAVLTKHDNELVGQSNILEALACKDAFSNTISIQKNLDLIPSTPILSRFFDDETPDDLLKETLEPIKKKYDYIFIDCPPSMDDETYQALNASDYAIIITDGGALAYKAVKEFISMMLSVRDNGNKNLDVLGIIINNLYRSAIDKDISSALQEHYPDLIFDPIIPHRTKINEFTITGIHERTKAARQILGTYDPLVNEIIKRLREEEKNGSH